MVLVCAIAMIAVLFLPIWRIDLAAPQYPEGLTLRLFAHGLGGDVDIVNGLNHYIGMRPLHTKDFVEFVVLPYIIGGFAALGFLVALFNRKLVFFGWVFVFLLIAFTAMIDFYRWEYNYGHDLNPEAPIQVPGMTYQPPLIGHKQLLNFSAFSIPDSGGWIFVGVGLLLVGGTILEIRRRDVSDHTRKTGLSTAGITTVMAGMSLLLLQGCQAGPQPIRYKEDNCDFCKMTFMDKRFGGEVCTKKGRVYKFDDIHCLLESLKAGVPARADIADIYLVDYNDGSWLRAEDAFLFRSDTFHTPMNGNVAAFSGVGDAVSRGFKGEALIWKELYR
jgi:copper chaperone NosL